MSQDNQSRVSRISNKRRNKPIRFIVRLTIIIITVLLVITAGLLLYTSLNQRGNPTEFQVNLGVNPALNPLEALYLSTYIAANQDALNTPVSAELSAILFEVLPGQIANDIGLSLVQTGLITDAELFSNYVRYYGLDRQLEAGLFELSPSMPIPVIAASLTEGKPAELTISIPEGWRREQVAAWIDKQANLPFNGADFLVATGISSEVSQEMSFTSEKPANTTLEGFLFPDTYQIQLDASANDLVRRMLDNYVEQVTPQMRTDATTRGMNMYSVLTIASIVEREARVPDEQPKIASVYLNRLKIGMNLEADPTVQYAMGYQEVSGEWWNLSLTQADYYSVDSPYNTYLYGGMPPGPIASPGIGAINAVIYPEETPYYFFRAACDDSGLHNFAETFEGHLANGCQ